MATVVSQHVRHLGRHLRKTAATTTETSRKHVVAASNSNIIDNKV